MVSTVTMKAGRPFAAQISSMYSGVARGPVAMTKMPLPLSSPVSAFSSSSPAMVEGIGRPPQPLWFGEKDEAKPAAPASSASRTRARMCASCSKDGSLRVEASCPITAVRMVECCASTATLP